ncbi:Holliday junction resolvase Hjc [Hyperthermus butylicus]|uniref:Crossover junction endodeoxyribonuclease Hjc n=1 Tax=Hyperthermus butylicus (strain DSM 5456 / JCM 9403 / PLM1-5) TaxID=415426 RepID=A2BM98_HYPBU|nr:Holliday junction resolvase Hjc [Hyperthermus butylicus]ABM81109.1 Holliday junction resolvase [Hyperthermus butylicus DSM 5456]
MGRAQIRSKGFNAERELARKLWSRGFAVVRAPASGSKAKHVFYPDLVAMYRGKIFVFEVKYRTTSETIYIEKEKILKLVDFAERAGGKAYIAIKLLGKGWLVVPVDNLAETAGGRYKIDLNSMKVLTLDEFVNRIQNESLTRYVARHV